jgi:hypothetical protein
VIRLCVGLNVWCGAYLSRHPGHAPTATLIIIEAIRRGECSRGDLALVISWGMLDRLATVLTRDFDFSPRVVDDLINSILGYAVEGPSLTLGGVGVLPIHDAEDRHVLETAWSGGADILATSDLRGFVGADAEVLVPGRAYRLQRADRSLIVAHPFETAAWLQGEDVFAQEER